jgi:hypothetical protein
MTDLIFKRRNFIRKEMELAVKCSAAMFPYISYNI